MATSQVIQLKTEKKPAKSKAPKAARNPSMRERLAIGSAVAIGGVAIAATALSLSDLADSIQDVAHVTAWKADALAVALDANFIATESFSLFATAATKTITLVISAVANSWAMAHTADDTILAGACIVAGCAIPGLIALATFTLG
jgi:hypothetical protein